MLTNLHIKNFLLIDDLELKFQDGLTVITGETGSGKSITVDALLLVFGAKGSADYIRKGSNQLLISAEFTTPQDNILQWLDENSLLDADNRNYINCRRVIDLNGKSKSFINGVVVNQSIVRDLGELLLDVHTQHASIMLGKSEHQRFLVDEFAKLNQDLAILSDHYDEYTRLDKALEKSQNDIEIVLIKKQILMDKITDLIELNIEENEWQELDAEHNILSNSKSITAFVNELVEVVDNDDDSFSVLLSRFESIIAKNSALVNTKPLELLINSVAAEVSEIRHELNQISKKINIDPDRLEIVEARMNSIYAMARKYRIDPQLIYTKLAEFNQELLELESLGDVAMLEAKRKESYDKYLVIANKISVSRISTAKILSSRVSALLLELSIKGVFEIEVSSTGASNRFGIDKIEFMISFNTGMEPKPLAKTASGGELSRVALAVYAVLSIHNPPEVIIFDEIDVGIGGVTASVVGKLLQELGKFKQIICITHQPQTASKGDQHLIVSKIEQDKMVKTIITQVAINDRVREIARMIAGDSINDTAIAHARSMLGMI